MNRLQMLTLRMKRVLTVLPAALLIGLGVLLSVLPQPVQAATSSVPEMIPSTGKDFWLTYMYNFGQNNDDVDLEIFVVAMRSDAVVTITTGDGTVLASAVAVSAGSAYTLTIPTLLRDKVYNTSSDVKKKTGVHVQASSDVSVYFRNGYSSGSDYSYDNSHAISTDALGTEYMIQTYYRDMMNNEFAIVATADGTTVEVTLSTAALKPSESPADLYDAGTILTRSLNAGEVIQIKGARYNSSGRGDLSGTTIKSNKPIAVFNGGAKASVPLNTGYNGDHTVDPAIPVSAWGKRFVAMEMSGFPDRKSTDDGGLVETSSPTQYMLTAMYDGTQVKVDGETICTLNKGENIPYDKISSMYYSKIRVDYNETPKLVETSNPVVLYAYMSSGAVNAYDYEVFSEPALALIPDVNKGVDTSYIYCAPTPSSIHFANVVVPASGVSDMKLNGVDVSSEFTTLSGTFDGYSKNYAYARLSLNSGVNILANKSAKFVAVSYSTEMYAAISEASVTAFNLAPIAPIMFIDDNEIVHGDTIDYCNRHPGVHFTAIVDYPHESVKWVLGEGAESTDYEASHMYGINIGEEDEKHDVKLFVYRESPITHIKDTDSICVTLDVHPVYYDTLKTKVAANKLEYIWNKSSNPAFGLTGKSELTVGPVTMGKNAPNANNKWTSANDSKVIFDSLVYATRHGCDSIFYLQLQVVPDILMPVENRTICQQEALAWAGHAAGAGHKMSRKNLTTNVTIYNVDGSGADMFKTDEYGTFEIRDTLVSKVFPYPDSIHVMNLTVYAKPTMGLTAPGAICQTDDDELQVAYTTTDANRFTYSLKNSSDDEVKSGMINSPGATGTLTITYMGSLPYGAYKLYATAYSEHDCHSVEASVDVTINVKPTLTLNDIDSQCYPAAAFEVSYDHTNATKVFYRVLQGETVKKAWTEETVVAAKKFTISTEGWEAATYTVQAYSQSADGCQSVQKEKTFTINVQPTVTSVTVANACDAETATELAFTTAHAATYNYYIVGQTALKATPVATTDGAHTEDLDISMLAAGDYTLKIVANSATCKSDTVSVDFTIYPMPTATITSLPTDLNACAPGTSNKTVNYTTTNASQIKWQLTTPHGVMNYDYAAVGSSLTVLQNLLVGPGTYKVKITGVKSAAPMNCEVLNPAGGEVTFTMYNPAAITLNDIAAVCAGNAVTSTYTAEYTDSYTYEVRTKTGNVLKGIGSSTTINGTIDLSKTDTLPAGTYVLSVTATNTNNCGSSSASKEFVINPIPVIKSLSTPDNVCETEVASRDVNFIATDAANILYTLKKGATVWNAENSVAVGAGKFSIKTDTLSAGDYIVEAKPVSGAGCTGAVRSVNFTVYPHPTVTLPASLPNACFGEESLTINYSTTYAATYAYTLADKDGNALTPGSGAAVASGSIVVPLTATMTAAKSPYKFRIEVTSDKGCKSGWVEKTFTIYPKPTAGITSVESKCDNETSAAVVYTSSNATKYEYRVFKSGVAAPVLTVTDQDVAGTTFNVDISTLDVGSYELRLVAKSATCESDTAKKSFDIWPLPVISTLDNTTPCEGEAVVNVPYTATNASKFSYTVKDGETVVKTVATATVADGKINVDIDGLTTGGAATKVYTLSVTATSDHNCVTAVAKTATITLKSKPAVTLSSVTNTCVGTGAAITVAYTGLTTNKLDYIVRKGGVDTSVSGTKTGLTPGVDGSFDISGATFEALAAGTDYEVEIIAQGDNGCPSVGVDQVKAFTIYPLPTVSVKSGYESVTVCEGREDAVFELTTSANASTYSYTTGALGLTATDQPVVDQKIKITLPKADLKDGDFTLTVTVKSAAPQSCSSVAATATLKVNNRPWLKINNLAAQCCPAESFSVAYTATDAAKIYWSVDGKIAEQTLTVAAPYSFTVNTSRWAAGTYTLRARPESALGCDSAAVVKTLTINTKPATPSNISFTEPCANATTMNVTFSKDAVGNCAVAEIVETAQQTLAGTPVDATSRMIPVNITGLTAGNTYTLRIYTFNNISNCQSDPVDKTFKVWPLPTVTLSPSTIDACYPAATISLPYTHTNAYQYSYTINLQGDATVLKSAENVNVVTGTPISLNTSGLAAGTYEVHVTAISERNCNIAAEQTRTFKIHPQPAITSLATVENVCEKYSPSAVALTMTGATKYNYEVLKEGVATPVEQKTNQTATSIALNTATWSAGKYTLKVTAVSDLDCGSDVEERVFLIYPQPKVTALGGATICETDAEASFSFTMTDAKTYTYDLKNGSDVSVASSASPQNVPAGGSGNIVINTAALPDGTYTLHVVATSDKGCVSDEKTSTLTINNRPWLKIADIAAECHPVDAFTVGYTFNDAKFVRWTVDDKITTEQTHTVPGSAPYQFTINTSGWAAGTYTLRAHPTSALGCDSAEVVKTFTIHPKPTVNNVFTIKAVCQNGSPRVDFKHTHGATVKYWIDGVEKSAVAINGTQDAAWFNADITGIAAGTNHKMKLQVISGTSPACESAESSERTFTIYPLPTITTYDTTAIYPVASVDVRYSAENASTYTYVMTGTGIPSLNPGTGSGTFSGGKIPVNTANLAPGTYELTVTAKSATSAGGCEKTATSTIVIYDPTSIEITEPIAGKCAENTTDKISITITTTFADKYSYVVKLGETEIESKTDQATTNNGATPFEKTFQLDKTTWTAGTYSISITAKNSDTGVTKDDASTFTIYPTPEITFTQPSAICEAEVSSVNVTYTNSNAETIKYHVDKLRPIPTADIVAEQEISANGTIALTTTGWKDGTYRIYATPTSQHDCVGEEKFVDLVVNNQPEAAITAMPTDVCEGETYLNVTYTASTDARAYAFRILNAATDQPVSGYAGNGTIQAPYGGGSFAVDVRSLSVGTYKMELKTQTEPGCWSEVSLQPFTVRDKPGATISKMESVCEGTATATAEYTTTKATTYYYTVKGTSVEGIGTTTGSGTISVDVSTLAAANSPYILQLVSKSTYCESDTAEKAFAIWPIPVVTITSINDVCSGDATTTVTYSPDANVSSCTYTLKQGTTVLLADQPVTLNPARTFTINTSALAAETYTVELTPRSSHTCTGAMVSTTFKVNPLPTLGDITLDAAAVCEGTAAMGATFAHTGATSYAWELRQQGSTTVLRSGNATGLVDATSAISIDLLAPSTLEAGKTYDLKVVVKNDATDCEQTKTASFIIRKNPVVTLSPEGTHICQPVTEFKFSYTNEDNRATVFHYQVLKGTDVIVPMADKMDIGASGDWTLPFGAELLQGEYKIHVTPANANCTGKEKILTFHVDTVMPSVTNATICYGETFDWVVNGCDGITPDTLMRGLTATTHQLDTLFCDGECVKVYELNLTAYPENLISEEQYTLCAGETYAWHGQSISKAGTYEAFEPGGANGCDKVYRIVVDQIVPEQKSASQTVCYGEPVIFNGKTYTNLPVGPQTLLDTIKSAGDCDSVYLKLNLTVGQRYYDSIVVTECDKYVWAVNGNTYNHSGIYREEMATVDGCDSVCVLNLTINPSYEFNETYDILNTQLPFTIHEFTYTAAGTYDREFVSVAGCDSIYHISLNVHELQLPRDTTTAAICAGATYTWQGNNYTAGGWYSVTENDGVNDVAIHVLHLNVNPTYSDTTYVHSCGTYNWRGMDYSASGIYPVLLPSSCGCDSTVVLKLTVGAPTASTVNVTACQYEPTTVGNRTFVAMANTSFTETLTNAAGCDSVVTYNVTVTPRIYTSPEDMYSFCEGESYTWHGHTYDKPGTYYDSVADANGCTTTIHTLILTQKQAYHFEEDVEVSELALPYAWVGHKADTLLRTNGDYYDRWTSQVTGCDSIYHIHFHVNWVTRDTIQLQGCESVNWSVNGHSYTYTESGLYSDTLFTDAPANTQYDVIHFCDVTVHPAYHVVDPDVTVCQDELPYVWRGQTYSDLTVGDNVRSINPKTVNGCDSTFTITIHVVKSFRDEQTYAACPSELPYLWHGQLLTVAGDYTDAHSSITGCDSTYVLHFSVKTVTEPDAENQIHCQGEQIQWHGLDFVANEPGEYAYYDWYVPNPDCPDYQTYHLLNLTVGEVYDVDSTLTEHVCQGQTFLWFNADRSVTQDNAHKLDDHTYVETFHYEEQTVLGCDSLSANLTLYMHLPYEKTLEDTTVCNSYDWDGLNITTTGDYEKVYPLHGLTCADSVLHRHFTVLYSETETITVDVCDSYYWDKTQQDYTESGTYVHSVPQMGGLCDKVYTLNLTVRKTVRDTVTINNWCHEFTWAATGTTYHTSKIDSVVYPGAASTGCDSIAYLRLTLVTDTVFYLPAVTACETYTWADGDGMTYTGDTTARYATTSVVTGCDSIVYLPITINRPVAVTHNLEGCRTLTWNDETFTTSKTGYVQVFDCDSVVTLNVTIYQPDTIHHVLRACESVTWNGQTYTYSQQAQQDFLCDSVVMLDITIDHVQTKDEYVTRWDSYTWEGDTYTATGNYTKTLTSACGCDSIVTLHLTINDSESDEETQIACESFDWAWSGLTYTMSGDYEVKKRIDVGLPTERDSTRTLHLGIGHKKLKAETVTDVCDAYVWHGTEYLTSGTYTYMYTDTCDGNVDTLHLTLYHKSVPVEYYDTACDVLTINGHSYFNSTEFTETFQTVHGCDSVVNFHLTINHRQTKSISAEACGSYTWEGTTYTESGVYNKVLTGANGCDSVVTLTLSIFPSYNHEFTAVGCGGHYVWDNRIYDAEGDYVWNYTSVSGCDSTVTMHLTMPATVSSTLDTTVCDYLDWNGVHYTQTGSYEAAFTSAVTGCDSIAKLHLNIAEHPAGEETVVEYTQAYVWGGQVYYQSGDYTRHIPLDDGRCDSIATLHLTITDPLPVSYEFSATACDAYTWDSETFYESGVYVRNFPTLDDRDSIVKLTLTIHHDTTVYVSDKHCVPYTWNDQTITESGVYTQVLERASGCDSVVTMTFISCERFETSFTAEARDVYTWEGNTYTESGEYTRLFQSRQGCDSLVTMYLTIVKTVYATDNAEACTQYAWADSLFTQSTIHTHIFPAATGGDSVVTMTLIIHEPVRTELFDTVREPDCSNPAYAYPLPWAGGESVQRAGIYTTTLASAIGCDSIVTLRLTWCDDEPCIADTSYQTLAACDSVQYEGKWYNTTGSYPLHYTTNDGCDSVHMLRVEIQPVARALIDTTACDSMYWAVTDKWYYQSGYDYDTLVGGAANGCDSITVMHVVIGHAGERTLDITSCDALTLNGETFKESGTYIQHLTTVTGCDSTLTINLTLSPAKDSTISGVACDDTVWNNVSYTASGSYPQVLQTAEGCDSVVTLNLIIYGSKDINYIDTIHCDSIVWGPDREGNDTVIYDDGIYTRTFQTAVGCDSTVTMDLRLLRHDLVIAPDTQACDSFVWNEKVYFESGTYNDTLVSSRTGCDSITTMFIQIDPTLYVEIEDSVPPPFYLWPTENDTIWESGVYVDTTASLVTGCDSITTLTLVMTDSIILDPQEPVRVDTFGYCPGDTMNFIYNLLKGHPTKYILIFDTVAPRVPDYSRDFMSVLDTTYLENHGQDSLFTVVIPEFCPAGVYCAHLQLFDDFSSSEVYDFCIRVNLKGAIVSMWTDVIAINNFKQEYFGYQWYRDDQLLPGATKQYYSDGEDLNGWYRAKVQLADSSWVFTCEEFYDLRTDSLELIAYPTPAPVGQPVTIKAMGILLEKLVGSRLTITNVQGVTIKEFTLEQNQRSVDVELSAGLYIATLVTGDADDRARTANVKFTVF